MDLINKYLKEQTPGYEYEYNYEGDMAKTQLNMMIDASMELKSMLANDTNLPEWVQSKITKAADYVDSARDYMKNMNKDPNGSMGEDVERKDTGWQKAQTDRKDQFGNRIKNVARRLARQGMQSAVKDLKKGPEAGKRQVEEVEELDEISKDTLKSYADKSIKDAETRRKQGSAYEKLVPSDPDYAKTFYKKSAKRLAGATKAMSRLAKEEVELDELKEPTVQKYITRAKFSTNPKRRAMAQKAQAKLQQKPNPMKTEEVEELEELKRRTLASYTGKAADQMANAAIDKSTGAAMGTMGRMSNMPDLAKKGSDKEDKAFQTILKRTKGITSASRRLAKEDVDLVSKYSKLGEAKYPGFRVRMTPGVSKLPRRGYGYVPQGDQDPRTGMPLGFSPIKPETKESDPSKKTKQS